MWGTLSPEIIFEIFGHFLPGHKLSITEPHQFPWYLGQVCVSWRSAFLTFPQLWSTLDIDLQKDDLNLATLERGLEILKESLFRSGNHPISFQFILFQESLCPSVSSWPDARCCGQMLYKLLGQSTRWRNAYFHLNIHEAKTLYRVKTRLPMLHSFQCRFVLFEIDSKIDTQYFSDFLVDAPQLTRISLDEGIKWNLDWSSITSLRVRPPPDRDVTHLLSCLKQARCLEELAIQCPSTLTVLPNDIRSIILPSLKALEVCGIQVLPLFETPALEELYIPYSETAQFPEEWITSSYIVSLRQLKRLSISPWSVEELKRLTQFMPEVQDLYMRCDGEDEIKLLPTCGKASEVRSLTLVLSRGMQRSRMEGVLKILTSWQKSSDGMAGFGPFNNLTKISIMFLRGPILTPNSFSQDVLDDFRRHFEDQGIQYSIRLSCDVLSAGLVLPPFDTL